MWRTKKVKPSRTPWHCFLRLPRWCLRIFQRKRFIRGTDNWVSLIQSRARRHLTSQGLYPEQSPHEIFCNKCHLLLRCPDLAPHEILCNERPLLLCRRFLANEENCNIHKKIVFARMNGEWILTPPSDLVKHWRFPRRSCRKNKRYLRKQSMRILLSKQTLQMMVLFILLQKK